MGTNLWETVARRVQGSSMALFLFIIGAAAGIIGLVLSWEDTVSSYYGIISLQQAFGITAVSAQWVLYVMAVAPWVGQVAFIGLWTLDTERKWALVVGIVWFVLDFVSDVQYRSTGTFIPLETGQLQFSVPVLISMGMTFLYFTIGAELFVTAASALTVTLFPDAVREVAGIYARSKKAMNEARQTWNQANREGRKRPQVPQGPDLTQYTQPQQRQGYPNQPKRERPRGQRPGGY